MPLFDGTDHIHTTTTVLWVGSLNFVASPKNTVNLTKNVLGIDVL